MPAIDVLRLTEDRPELLRALALVRAETDAELNPHDPPAPVPELAAELFAPPDDLVRHGWVACLDGEPAGELTVAVETDEANRHIAHGEWLAVRPGLRRNGVADALLAAALDQLAAEGCTSLLLWAPSLVGDPGGAYAARLGLTVRIEERCSRLLVADLDEDLVDAWVADGRARSDGYRIEQWVGPCPDAFVDAVVAAHRAMEDMPIDDLEWTIPPMTPGKLRARDEAWDAAGRRNVTTLAVAPDGSGAGISELQINGHRPSLAAQGDTGVRAAHRGRGLGRWLKAENLRLARETEPRIAVVETYNAQTNPWMLGINVAMGFRPHVANLGFQGDLAGARRVLGPSTRRGVGV